MPTAGLLLTCVDSSAALRVASEAKREPGVLVGEPTGALLPLAHQAPDPHAPRALSRRLADLDGVSFVELVFCDFSDLEPDDATPSDSPRCSHGTT